MDIATIIINALIIAMNIASVFFLIGATYYSYKTIKIYDRIEKRLDEEELENSKYFNRG